MVYSPHRFRFKSFFLIGNEADISQQMELNNVKGVSIYKK